MQMDQAQADRMVEQAIAFCADKKFAGDIDQTRHELRKGRCDACEYLSYSLVKQIGEYLGQVDRTVKAVYAYKPDRAPLTQYAGNVTAGRRASGINLIAWVDRKSPVLTALGSSLESFLTVSRRKIGCVNATPACCNLDIQMVEDREVQESRGLGVIIQSMYVRSLQIWSRVETQIDGQIILPGPRRYLQDTLTSFNPELAPEELLLEQALVIEKMPASERSSLTHRLQEERVVLIRNIISDQLEYINIAKDWFTVSDLVDVRKRKIGYGKVGGKAAGLLLAARILQEKAEEPLLKCIRFPESYYLGSDLIYVFMSANGLSHWNDQKYKTEEEMRGDYPRIKEEFQAGEFPPDILEKLQDLLDSIGPMPIIVRSSSQLEDNFGTSFAGKYNSYFCPNQGSRSDNLRNLTKAISRTYASTLKPDALLYRRSKGLQDYDERMAVIIQVVQGERWDRYFLPPAAGVAFSKNLYRWSPQIRRDEGFARLVWGLGTRAVERVGNDFPRLVALGHPLLQPDDSPEAIRHYSQQYVDLMDLQENTFKTLPVNEVLASSYPPLRYIADIEQEGYFAPVRSRVPQSEISRLAITFNELLRRTCFADHMAQILRILESHYHKAVDLEFTVQISDPYVVRPEAIITVLQCRPQSHLQDTKVVTLPVELSQDEIIFSTHFMVPQGYVAGIRYILFVPPREYFRLTTSAMRNEIGRVIAKLNNLLPPKSFICVGPGRWGTTNTDLGVFVSYADIYNAAALVELSGKDVGPAPEPSLGTHFFQDLMEAQIFPLAIILDQPENLFNRDFFYNSPNQIGRFVCIDEWLKPALKLIDVHEFFPGSHADLIMDDEKGQAVAFINRE